MIFSPPLTTFHGNHNTQFNVNEHRIVEYVYLRKRKKVSDIDKTEVKNVQNFRKVDERNG